MKKGIILLLAVICLISLMAGCAKKDNSKKPSPTASATAIATATPAKTASPTPEPTPEPSAPPSDTNVALNKPYEVSSETGEAHAAWGWSSEFINDGIIEADASSHTGWTSNVGIILDMEDWEDQWVWIDLQQNVTISKVVLYPRQDSASNFPVDYHIEVSKDNKNFETVASVTGDTRSDEAKKEPSVLTFDKVEARYVKLVVTKPYGVPSGTDGYLVQLAEMEVYSAAA